MTQVEGGPFNDAATRDAAQRLVDFLRGELEELPSGHPWRRRYTLELISVSARFDVSEA